MVDAPGRLTTIATQIATASPGGNHVVRFKTYADVGAFNLTGLNADSLIFEREGPSAEVVEFTGILFRIENTTAAVVFRGLAFKALNESSQFVLATSGASNRNLLIDSCQIFGDRFNATFLSWYGGDTSSHIGIKRSFIVAIQGGAQAKIDFSAKSVTLTNNHFNFPGLLVAKTPGQLVVSQNTVNRMQFDSDGNGIGTYSFTNNLFAFSPLQNRLPVGGDQKFLARIRDFLSSTAQNNTRFDTWAGFDFSNPAAFPPASGNTSIAPFGDSLALWNFGPIDGNTRGHINPPGAFPAYNVFPGDTILSLRLSPADSLDLRFSSASIPRIIQAAYGNTTYPATTDSSRSFWLNDTTLQIIGPTSVQSLTFPEATSQGAPLLFARSGNDFTPGIPGASGSLTFANASPTARTFIPAFAGQNTPKGSQVTMKGFSADTTVRFNQITRAGITSLSTPDSVATGKRTRIIRNGLKPAGIALTTNAEGSGSIRIGLAHQDAEKPWRADSLKWRHGDNNIIAATDSVGKWWGDLPFSQDLQALLIERLALGAGQDTLELSQGHTILSKSAKGHQLQIDSTSLLESSKFPDLGMMTKPLVLRWPGRAPADSLRIRFRKNHARQKVFRIVNDEAQPQSPLTEDSLTFTLALNPTDTAQTLLLARRYAVPANVKTDIALEADSALGLLSNQAGDLILDSNYTPIGLKLDTLRILAQRKIDYDNLSLQEAYTLVLTGLAPNRPERMGAFVLRSGGWVKQNLTRSGNRYRIGMQAQDQAVLAVETLSPSDTLPVQPKNPATAQIEGNRLTLTPALSTDEKSRLKAYFPEITIISPNGKIERKTPPAIPGDSSYTLDLPSGFVVYRLGYQSYSDLITWDASPTPIAGSAAAFRSSVNSTAPNYPERVKSLVGFPHDLELGSDLLNAFSANQAGQSIAKEWQGEWVALKKMPYSKRGKVIYSPYLPP